MGCATIGRRHPSSVGVKCIYNRNRISFRFVPIVRVCVHLQMSASRIGPLLASLESLPLDNKTAEATASFG